MRDDIIVILTALGLMALVVLLPICVALIDKVLSDYKNVVADIMRRWLSPKTAIIAAATAFLCWQAYRARCAYESRCRSAVAAYEKVK